MREPAPVGRPAGRFEEWGPQASATGAGTGSAHPVDGTWPRCRPEDDGVTCSARSNWPARSPGMSGSWVNSATATMYSPSPAQPRPSATNRRMWSRTFGSLLYSP